MKDKKTYIIIILLVVLALSLVVIFKQKQTKVYNNLKNIWSIYDKDLENIENNMNEITVSNEDFEWWELKDFSIEDDSLKGTYNSLAAYIRMCYIFATDDGTNYTDSNPVKSYKDKEYITQKELQNLQGKTKEDSCLKYFDNFELVKLSNDGDISNKILDRINVIIALSKSSLFTEEYPTFDEIVAKEVIKIKAISDLSDWLKDEYYLNIN